MREELHATIPAPKEWKPSRIMALKNYEIIIKFLDRGVQVSVGCRTIAFESLDTFLKAFNEYVTNPVEAQEDWLKSFDNND
jgi:hypothetical protein